uniref:Uncharacterized protein n=1 Tax=Rhizophora mucronata TaxID=61149 RepID=A0A2P2QEH8_RHIMU
MGILEFRDMPVAKEIQLVLILLLNHLPKSLLLELHLFF